MTTDRATLLALADRVEKASGPDRELDACIHLHAVCNGACGVYGGEAGWLAAAKRYGWNLRNYTASIDAALALVPDGWRKMVDDLDRTPEAIVSTPDQKRSWDGRAATMPLALTAAALRALAQEAPSDG